MAKLPLGSGGASLARCLRDCCSDAPHVLPRTGLPLMCCLADAAVASMELAFNGPRSTVSTRPLRPIAPPSLRGLCRPLFEFTFAFDTRYVTFTHIPSLSSQLAPERAPEYEVIRLHPRHPEPKGRGWQTDHLGIAHLHLQG